MALAPGSVKAVLPSGAVMVRPCWHRSDRPGTPLGPFTACSPVVLRVMANVWLLLFVAAGHEMVPWPAGGQAAVSGALLQGRRSQRLRASKMMRLARADMVSSCLQ